MTRRERLEARLERRRAWAANRERQAEQAFTRAHAIADQIPLGQPILVGHHSERRARRDQDRIHSAMSAGVAASKIAAHHEAKAAGLADQLARSVFADDPDAIEALEERIARLEEDLARKKQANAAFRATKGAPGWAAVAGLSERVETTAAEMMRQCPWIRLPFDPTNDRATVRRLRQRLDEIRTRQARQQAVEEAGGTLVTVAGAYALVQFAERPDDETLAALRAAGYTWRQGRWAGLLDRLPDDLRPFVGAVS